MHELLSCPYLWLASVMQWDEHKGALWHYRHGMDATGTPQPLQ